MVFFLHGNVHDLIDPMADFLFVLQCVLPDIDHILPMVFNLLNGFEYNLTATGIHKVEQFEGMSGFFLELNSHPVGKARQVPVFEVC